MKNVGVDQWRAFGRLVHAERMKQGYGDVVVWADRVGRSTRVIYGLERGEPIGAKTLLAVGEALGWSVEATYDALESGKLPTTFGEVIETARAQTLKGASDFDLASELERRFRERNARIAELEQVASQVGETPGLTRGGRQLRASEPSQLD